MKWIYRLIPVAIVALALILGSGGISRAMRYESEARVRGERVAAACLSAGESPEYCEGGCAWLEPLSAFLACRDAVRYAQGSDFRERFGGNK